MRFLTTPSCPLDLHTHARTHIRNPSPCSLLLSPPPLLYPKPHEMILYDSKPHPQLLYITGRPTPDTRRRFFSPQSSLDSSCTTTAGGVFSKVNASVANGNVDVRDLGLGATYDLVCCSLRLLEDAPSIEPDLVGKGDDWEDDREDYLTMDLAPEAVASVDTPEALEEMGIYLRKASKVTYSSSETFVLSSVSIYDAFGLTVRCCRRGCASQSPIDDDPVDMLCIISL